MDTYRIKIKHFEGPFDLLLFFIERDELDIHDIPIAKITDDFLAHIKLMEELNIDVASEFILVAATLMKIKAKMLIPRREVDEEGNEIDPRAELAQKLIEYQRYKSVLADLRNMEEHRSTITARGNAHKEMQTIANKALVDVELESLTLYRLFDTFQRILQRYSDASKEVTVHKVQHYNYTIEEQRSFILQRIHALKGRAEFNDIFTDLQDRIHAIVTFLSLLELLNLQLVHITQGEGMNNFWINGTTRDEEE